MNRTLISARHGLFEWLTRSALPLWWQAGADKVNGGFFERLRLDGQPLDEPRRFRVQPRQVYCYAMAGRLGWNGPWQAAAVHGLDYFERVYRLPDGTYAALATSEGSLLDDRFDLYNQAFALLAFASVAIACPELASLMEGRAERLRTTLLRDFKHPDRGFEEANPPKVPLRSNPHMHLLEASLAWEEAAPRSAWGMLSDEIASLCMDKFVDRRSGALREFFDHRWDPQPGPDGRLLEPGHHFEWAWLLLRWATARRSTAAIEVARTLFDIGEAHGVDSVREAAIGAISDDFHVLDPVARLWPQTEWLKASLALAGSCELSERPRYLATAAKAAGAMQRFLDVPTEGLWRDKLLADGSFVEEAAPASSFYHMVGAIAELDAALKHLR